MITLLLIPVVKWRPIHWLGVLLCALAFTLAPQVTFAQDETAPVAAEDVGSQFVISSPTWTIITGALLPIAIGLITKASANNTFQAIFGIVTAAVGALVIRATTVDGAAVFDQALIVDVALVYIPQIAAYLGVWKNLQLNQRLAPNSGFG